MEQNGDIPKGIWYEKERRRWRVKLVSDGVLLHRSYHKNYSDALEAWQDTKRKMVYPRPVPKASLINQFLCRPLVGSSRVQGH